jgi:hypothetical protein
MPAPKMTDEQFIAEWQKHGSATAMLAATGIDVRPIYERRKRHD